MHRNAKICVFVLIFVSIWVCKQWRKKLGKFKNLKNLTEKSRERKKKGLPYLDFVGYFRFNFLQNVAKIRKIRRYQDSRILLLFLSFSVLNSHVGNEVVKMPPDFERYEHQVEDMYNILLNISSELLTIKTMMKANRKLASSQQDNQEANNKNEGKSNCTTDTFNWLTPAKKWNLEFEQKKDWFTGCPNKFWTRKKISK